LLQASEALITSRRLNQPGIRVLRFPHPSTVDHPDNMRETVEWFNFLEVTGLEGMDEKLLHSIALLP